MRLSVSKIGTYEQCPYKYKLHYLDEVKPNIPPPEHLIKGVEIHEVFDEVLASQPKTIDALKENIKRHPKAKKYQEHMQNFIKFNEQMISRTLNDGKLVLPLYQEIELFDHDLNIVGVIDRVDMTGKHIIILDYKTGKESQIRNHHFQLGIYKYLFEKTHNMKITHWGIFYSATGKLEIEPVNNDIVKECVEKVISVRKKIKLETIWPKKPGPLCNFCDFFKSGHCEGISNKQPTEKFWEDG